MAKSDVENEDLLGLNITFDETIFARLQSELNKVENEGKSINEVLQQMVAAETKVTDAADKMGQVLNTELSAGETKLTEVTKKVEGLSTQLAAATEKASTLSKHLKPDFLPEQGYLNSLAQMGNPRPGTLPEQSFINQLTQGKMLDIVAPRTGYQPPITDLPDIEPPGMPSGAFGAGSKSTSARGLAFGLMSMGFTMQAPGMLAASSILSMEEGLRSSIPLFEQLSAKIADNSGKLSPFISGLTGLGVPFAGLLTVAVPLGIALAAVVTKVSEFMKIIQDGQNAVAGAIDQQDKYHQYLATGATSEDARKRIENEQRALSGTDRTVGNLRGLITNELAKISSFTPEEIEKILKKDSPLRDAIMTLPEAQLGPLKTLFEQFDKLQERADKAKGSIAALENGIKNGDFVANDAAKRQEEQIANQIGWTDRQAALKKQEAADLQMTSEAAQKRLETLKADRDINLDQMNALRELSHTSEAARKKYEDLQVKVADETAEINALTNEIIPLIVAREAEADRAKRTKENLDAIASAQEKFNEGQISAAEQLANQTENATLRAQQAEQEYTAGSIQDLYARNQISLKTSRDQAKIEQDTADRITDIRTKLTQKEQQLTTDLQRQIFDDRIKFNNDWAKLDRNYQNQAQEDQIKHLEKLEDVNKQASTNQQQALLDRNFLQLAKDAQSKQTQIDQENTHYARQEAQRQRHLQQQQVELTAAFTQEQTHKQILNERKRADADLQANQEIAQQQTLAARKLIALRQSEQQQIDDLVAMQQYKIQIIRQGLANELILYQQQELQRIAILERQRDQIVAKAMSQLLQPGGQVGPSRSPTQTYGIGSGRLFDTGGNFGAGESFIMSENRPELLNFGAGGYRIPGAALVYPLQSGSVDANRSQQTTHATYAPNINVYESKNPEETARLIDQKNLQLMKDFFGS